MIDANVLAVINAVIKIEKGYVNHPDDPGGETKYGITIATARWHGYMGEMKDLTKEQAREIYLKSYFIAPRFDEVFELSNAIGWEVFDSGVNTGVMRPARWLQQSLNALGREHSLYPELKEDGYVGDKTLDALEIVIEDESVIVKMLDCLQGAHYVSIDNQTMIRGWFNHRIR